jgi:hypothetical protein
MQQRRHGGQQDAQLAHVFQYSESEIVICRTSDVTFPTPHTATSTATGSQPGSLHSQPLHLQRPGLRTRRSFSSYTLA